MSVGSNSTDRPSEDVTNASNINADEIVADELHSLLDAVDSESIAGEFRSIESADCVGIVRENDSVESGDQSGLLSQVSVDSFES